MRNKHTLLIATLLVLILSLGSLVVTAGDQDDEVITTTRAPGDPYLDIGSDTLANTVYPGDTVEFAFRIDEDYDGDEWDDSEGWALPFFGSARAVCEVGVTIATDGPATWTAQSVYVPDNPWNITGNEWIFHNEDGDDFAFRITTSNIMPGDYSVTITVTYRLAISYNHATTADPNDYNVTSLRQESLTLDFEVQSCMENEFATMRVLDFTATTGNPGSLYAGVAAQKIAFRAWTDGAIGKLENVKIDMVLPTTGQTADISYSNRIPSENRDNCIVRELYNTQTYFYFYVDVTSDITPGLKDGAYVMLTYDREINDALVTVTESMQYDITFRIAYTAIVDVPDHLGGTTPLVQIDQETLDDPLVDITVPIANTGNVDIYSTKVELVLTESFFIDESSFFKVDDQTDIQEINQVVDLGSLNQGESKDAVFQANFMRQLPPGIYALRLNYDLEYYENGELGDPSQMAITDEGEYDDIMKARGNEGMLYDFPYIVIEILDPQMDMFGYAGTITPGMKNLPLTVTVVNKETYGISVEDVTLDGGGYFTDASMLEEATDGGDGNATETTTKIPAYSMSADNWAEFVPEANTWYDNDIGQYSTYSSRTFTFMVNVEDDIEGTYHKTTLTITGYDMFYQMHTIDVDVTLVFRPGDAEIVVATAYTENGTGPGSANFEYSITLVNAGDSTAEDLRVMLASDLDAIIVEDPLQEVGDLAPGEDVTVTFHLTFTDKARQTIDIDDFYALTLYWGFTDWEGNVGNINDNAKMVFITTSAVKQVDPVQPVMSNDMSMLVQAALIFAGMFLAAIIIMVGLSKVGKGGKKEKPAKEETPAKEEEKDDTPPPPDEPGPPESDAIEPEVVGDDDEIPPPEGDNPPPPTF